MSLAAHVEPRRRERRSVLATGAVLAGGAAYVAVVDPGRTAAGPPCPLHALTGWWCPACGTTRAVHAALHLDLGAAFGFNVFFPAFVAAIAGAWFAWYRRATGRHEISRLTPSRTQVAVFAVLLLLFTVARNLPVGRDLAP